MHGIKGILFDNDGTLVDTRDLIFESFKYATQQVMGRPVTDEEIETGISTVIIRSYDTEKIIAYLNKG